MHKMFAGALLFLFWACDQHEKPTPKQAFEIHCGSCHLPPDIQDLPRQLWSEEVLPEMAARMGISTPGYDPMAGMSFEERKAVIESGIFPTAPVIDRDVYKAITSYILESAPEHLEALPETPLLPLDHVRERSVSFPARTLPSLTYLEIRNGKIEVGDLSGGLSIYDPETKAWKNELQFDSPVVSSTVLDSTRWVLTVGLLNPSERSRGRLIEIKKNSRQIIWDSLHRPVHLSVSENASEFTIAEFGHFTGGLSIGVKNQEGIKRISHLPTPGALRSMRADIDGDNLPEQLVLFAQGDERLVAMHRAIGDEQHMETLLRFQAISGISWFDLADIDSDGDLDVITAHGDNADKTYAQKPYHGIRIHLNDGKGNFTQEYNYPMHGATRVVATDWDLDGDPDLAAIAAFPDYSQENPTSFVLLENTGNKDSPWKARSISGKGKARWFLMDADDIDADGDEDLVLGVFNYHITPVPENLLEVWSAEALGLLILENTTGDGSIH